MEFGGVFGVYPAGRARWPGRAGVALLSRRRCRSASSAAAACSAGPPAAAEDGVGELVARGDGRRRGGPAGRDIDVVDAGGRGAGRWLGRSSMSRPPRSSSANAVGVVVRGLGWLVQVARLVDVVAVCGRVGRWRVGVGVGLFGGVGDVGVDGGGVVGEQFDAVGEQAGVFVGARGLSVAAMSCRCSRRRRAGRPAASRRR